MKNYLKEHYQYLIKPSKFEGCDLLRVFAVMSVWFFHNTLDYTILRIGWVGVDLFFVLSGFLIGGIIIDEYNAGTFKYIKFLKNRFLRIYPVYIFIFILTIVRNYFYLERIESFNFIYFLRQFSINFLFLTTIINWFGVNVDPNYWVDGAWSLGACPAFSGNSIAV